MANTQICWDCGWGCSSQAQNRILFLGAGWSKRNQIILLGWEKTLSDPRGLVIFFFFFLATNQQFNNKHNNHHLLSAYYLVSRHVLNACIILPDISGYLFHQYLFTEHLLEGGTVLGTRDTGTNKDRQVSCSRGVYILLGKRDKTHDSQGNKIVTTSDNVECHEKT